eukprot:scaffold7390_cov420-Prasinococcus_capsulatus_cf.AAC.13
MSKKSPYSCVLRSVGDLSLLARWNAIALSKDFWAKIVEPYHIVQHFHGSQRLEHRDDLRGEALREHTKASCGCSLGNAPHQRTCPAILRHGVSIVADPV